MSSTKEATEIQNLQRDFSEVEWKVADPIIAKGAIDYGELESVKALLEGTALEVPLNTQTARLYRWLKKNGYMLRRKKMSNFLVIWVEKITPKS